MNRQTRDKMEDAIGHCFNCCSQYEFDIRNGNLEIIFDDTHENMIDQGSLGTLLQRFKALGVVQETTQAFWVGLRGGKLLAWCVAKDIA